MPDLVITVAGASGNLGVRMLKQLLIHPFVQARGFARSPAKIPAEIRQHERFTAIEGDALDAEKAKEAVQGASVVICVYQGFEEVVVGGQKILIDACEAAGVDRYFAGTFTLDFRKLQLGQLERTDCTIKVAQYLETKNIKAVHVLIGAFVETWLGYMDIWDPKKTKFALWGSGDEPWDFTTYDDTAALTVAAALDSNAVGVLKFRGDRKSTREIAEIYEAVYKRKPTLESRGSLQELWDYMHATKENHSDNKWAYMNWFYQYHVLNGQGIFDGSVDNDRYPNIRTTNIEQFFRHNDISDDRHRQMP